MKEEKKASADLIYKYFLPLLSFEMNKRGIETFNEKIIEEVASKSEIIFHFESVMNNPIASKLGKKYKNIELSLVLPILKDDNVFITPSARNEYSFSHKLIFDFFVALHLQNEIEYHYYKSISFSSDGILAKNKYSKEILKSLGELFGEHRNIPNFNSKSEEWEYRGTQKSIIVSRLDSLRNEFKEKGIGIVIWNLLAALETSKKELSGIDLSRLNLLEYNFHDVILSRGSFLKAAFYGALLNSDQFFDKSYNGFFTCFCSSPNGEFMAIGSNSSSIIEFNLQLGIVSKIYKSHGKPVTEIVYSPNGMIIMSSSHGEGAKVWDVKSGLCLKKFVSKSTLKLVCSLDGKSLLLGKENGSIESLSFKTFKKNTTYIGHESSITKLKVLDKVHFISFSNNGSFKKWNSVTGECLMTINFKDVNINGFCLTENHDRIFISVSNGSIILKDLITGTGSIIIDNIELAKSIDYNSQSKKMLTVSEKGEIKIFGENGLVFKPLESSRHQLVYANFIPGSDLIGGITKDGKIVFWNLKSWMEVGGITNYGNLIIQDCDFKNLHSRSVFSSKEQRIIQTYGGKLGDSTKKNKLFYIPDIYLDSSKKTPISPEMLVIDGGDFEMGDRLGDGFRFEKPVHPVYLNTFMIGVYPVTFEEYDLFCIENNMILANDRRWGRGRRPIIHVSWYDAINYCNWLSQKFDMQEVYQVDVDQVKVKWNANGYRLPTEAEWEYAARGGKLSKGFRFSGSNHLDDVGVYSKSSKVNSTKDVGTKKPNELGLFDMSGNVLEWCWDWYNVEYYSSINKKIENPKGPDVGLERVVRGGNWQNNEKHCRISYRSSDLPTYRYPNLGFRLVKSEF